MVESEAPSNVNIHPSSFDIDVVGSEEIEEIMRTEGTQAFLFDYSRTDEVLVPTVIGAVVPKQLKKVKWEIFWRRDAWLEKSTNDWVHRLKIAISKEKNHLLSSPKKKKIETGKFCEVHKLIKAREGKKKTFRRQKHFNFLSLT